MPKVGGIWEGRNEYVMLENARVLTPWCEKDRLTYEERLPISIIRTTKTTGYD
jgi:hypothetical protein